MKKSKLKFEKFRIAKLTNLSSIVGGTGTDSSDCDENTNPITTTAPPPPPITTIQTSQTGGTGTGNGNVRTLGTLDPGTSGVTCPDVPG